MNWSKTKSILILALIITNAVLLAYVIHDQRGRGDAVAADRMVYRQVLEVLKQRDMTVAFSEFPEPQKIRAVEASFETYEVTGLAQSYLGDGYTVRADETEAANGSRTLKVQDKILLVYDDAGISKEAPVPPEEEALQIARTFLKDKGLYNEEGILLMSSTLSGSDREIVFGQQLSGRFIANGTMKLIVSGEGVRHFERKWFQIQNIQSLPYEIIPPGRALLKLSEELPSDRRFESPVTITRMELGYKLDTDAFETAIFSGGLSPYWRFTTRSGGLYYVNALK